jgi:hypothetical protein
MLAALIFVALRMPGDAQFLLWHFVGGLLEYCGYGWAMVDVCSGGACEAEVGGWTGMVWYSVELSIRGGSANGKWSCSYRLCTTCWFLFRGDVLGDSSSPVMTPSMYHAYRPTFAYISCLRS